MMRFLLLLLGLGTSMLLVNSQTIFEIADTTDNFSTLATALTLTGLDRVFGCNSFFCFHQVFTVFAPTNDAFAALPSGVLDTLTTNEEYRRHLRNILLYHVTIGRRTASTINDGAKIRTLAREVVNATVANGTVMLNDAATVVMPDVTASNGVIHAIDRVLLPSFMTMNIAQVAQKAGVFDTLLTAVEAAGLTDALSGDGPFTLFAPTDGAFERLGNATVQALLDNIVNLTSVLTYHVVPDTIVLANELRPGPVATLQGENISVAFQRHYFSQFPTLNGNVRVRVFDILASNGVIHVIDKVLFPPSFEPPLANIAEIAIATSDLSTLVGALSTANLVDTLSNPGNFTVFAPTNLAFDMLESPLPINNTDALRDILLYHVVDGVVKRRDLKPGLVSTLLNDGAASVNVQLSRFGRRRARLNGNSRVIQFDIPASNGVVHLIDRVLIPPSDIVGVAMQSGLSTLVDAVVAAGLTDALQGEGPLTVFAPTDRAFAALGSLDALLNDTATLSQILQYHVIPGLVTFNNLTVGDVPTLQGESITVDFRLRYFFYFFSVGGAFTINNANIIAKDVTASNGIIHVIDEVLIPPSIAGNLAVASSRQGVVGGKDNIFERTNFNQ